MLAGMNSDHAKLADWGMAYLKDIAPKQIADLGCGGGRNAGELLKKYPDAFVTALDYSALSVQKAADYNRAMIDAGRCKVLQGDVSRLPLHADSFDLATAFENVYFWPGLEACFSQVAGILRSDGSFMICNESDEIGEALEAAGFSYQFSFKRLITSIV